MSYAVSLLFPFALAGRRSPVHPAVESFIRDDLLERLSDMDGGEFELAIAIDLDRAGAAELPERLGQLHRLLRSGGEALLCVTRGDADRGRLLARLRRDCLGPGFWAELRVCAADAAARPAPARLSRLDLAEWARAAGFAVEELSIGASEDAEFALRAVKRGGVYRANG